MIIFSKTDKFKYEQLIKRFESSNIPLALNIKQASQVLIDKYNAIEFNKEEIADLKKII
ncbi:hypothetical protein M1D69_17130 [Bacillus sp. PK3-037]|uniref:hypothetical protein n=1 Tax=Bacillus halotolerans TaxID=260554 RepID=UPI00403F73D8